MQLGHHRCASRVTLVLGSLVSAPGLYQYSTRHHQLRFWLSLLLVESAGDKVIVSTNCDGQKGWFVAYWQPCNHAHNRTIMQAVNV